MMACCNLLHSMLLRVIFNEICLLFRLYYMPTHRILFHLVAIMNLLLQAGIQLIWRQIINIYPNFAYEIFFCLLKIYKYDNGVKL
jgi:hypothetical protein